MLLMKVDESAKRTSMCDAPFSLFLPLSPSFFSFHLLPFGRYPRTYDVRKTAGWLTSRERVALNGQEKSGRF